MPVPVKTIIESKSTESTALQPMRQQVLSFLRTNRGSAYTEAELQEQLHTNSPMTLQEEIKDLFRGIQRKLPREDRSVHAALKALKKEGTVEALDFNGSPHYAAR